MIVARWQGKTIAKSDKTIVVEGNHYFPPEDVDQAVFVRSEHQTTCPWKGKASYKHITVEGDVNANAAWFYPEPSEAAKEIKGYFAFWKGVEITEE